MFGARLSMSTTQLGGLDGESVGGPLLQNGSPQVTGLFFTRQTTLSNELQLPDGP